MTVDRASMVEVPILLFAIYGFWCPLWWSTKWKFAYYCYTIFSAVLLITHMFTQLFNIIFNIDDLSDLARNCLSLMPTIDACAKAANILINRQKFISLLNMFEEERCQVRDHREKYLQRKYEKFFGTINKTTIILIYATVGIYLAKPFLRDWHARKLPFMSWFPYPVDNEINFWSTYAYEILSTPYVALIDLANVLLAISLMGRISLQLDILSYRIHQIAGYNYFVDRCERKKKLVDWVNHHLFIFELANITQRCFVATFFMQMFVSLVGLCTGAYLLAISNIASAEFHSALLFLACMIVLTFPCCWFGNEVYLKSLEIGTAIYKTNWTVLEVDFRKDLLNIIMRSKRPIVFASGPSLRLSNTVFMHMLQASYTAFTVLQQVAGRDFHQNR